MKIINGKKIAQEISRELKQKITAKKIKPGLAVILVGDDPASKLYVALKEKAAAEVGIHFEKHTFPSSISEGEIIKTIGQFNQNKNIHGILVQLPLPAGLNADKIISAINPAKDVDGFLPQSPVEPVLGQAVWRLISEAVKPEKHKILIIGNSKIFLKTLADYFKHKGAETQTALSKEIKLLNTQHYDIVVIAAGQIGLLHGDDFKDGAVVIDIGTNRSADGQTVGDVDFASTVPKPGWITPVPGGVGPVTVATLLENTYLCAVKALKKP
jgi:methylenetetrahydrofolate dehydrogenase (NADP+)/methenyltetrahydrofolate cyclohydrolase